MTHDRPLPDVLYDEVRARIVAGTLRPNTPVRQDTLAAELGVSKIPLREALSRLEHDGLVTLNPRRGYEVAPLDPKAVEDIFDLRLRIEPAAAAQGCEAATDADRAEARRALEALNRATEAHDAATPEFNRAFHLALITPAGRPLTTQLVERLNILAERYVREHLKPQGRSDRAQREHQELYDAWAAGRTTSVTTLLEAHIGRTLDDLRAQLKDRE
ncbi:MAG TPA: GntR family transcriptional regulator [Caulobacteraceae bacterium]|jgi:DNA-binding GntR family transcriptional regulator